MVRELRPEVSALYERAADLVAAGRVQQALPLLEECIAASPENATYRFAAGVAHLGAGRHEAAAQAFRAAAERRPDYVEAIANLGACLAELGRAAEAHAEFERALGLAPRDVDLLCNAALASIEAGEPALAVSYLARASALRPREARVADLQGIASMALGRAEHAERAFRLALELAPMSTAHAMGLSAALETLDRHEDAIATWTRFLAGAQHDARAHFQLALLLLCTGRTGEAMPHFAHRSTRAGHPAVPGIESLRGARVLVEAEQGIGDELFFLRWLEPFRAAAAPAELGYRPSDRFAPLARTIRGIDTHWSGPPEAWPGPRILAGDLPGLAGGSHAATLALAPEPARVERARRELHAHGRAPFLGVAWEGGTAAGAHRAARARAGALLYKRVPPDALGAALAGYPGTVLVVQRAPTRADFDGFARALGRAPADLSRAHDDIRDLHALLAVLDEYVGVSTTAMHLRAAAGGSAHVLVPHPPEWRWQARGEASPWFPGFRLYRERRGEGWSPPLARLRSFLRLDA